MSSQPSSIQHGNFTALAEDYAKYRPAYSESALTALLALVGKPTSELACADVGAGTGIWTRMIASRGPHAVTAVEPNDAMREQGIALSSGTKIQWRAGSGSDTGLAAESADLITAASCFHWIDFEAGTAEFARVLRRGGRFAALWNPRLIEGNALLEQIEGLLTTIKPDLRRVSSGRSGITADLSNRLAAHPAFEDLVYLEGRHVSRQSPAAYLGAWRSVNDIRAQLGDENFARFLEQVEGITSDLPYIETTYLTRMWSVRRK